MNRRGFLKKLGIGAAGAATALVLPEWLEVPKGRSMITVPDFRRWVTAVDPAVGKDCGAFLVPEGFSAELLRDGRFTELERLIREDIAQSMAARVEADFIKGTSGERFDRLEQIKNSRLRELGERFNASFGEFGRAAAAAVTTESFRRALEDVKENIVPVRTGILRRALEIRPSTSFAFYAKGAKE